MGVTAVRLLSSLGLLVIIVQAQDCSKPVPGPNMDLKGNNILLTVFPDGTSISFACNIGYSSAGGSPSITCTAGSWSDVQLKCEKKSCGAVDEVENGHIEYQPGNEYGDKAVIICNIGYMTVGKGSLICGDQGWEGRLPVCEVVMCESPPAIADGSYSPNKDTYDYREVIRYTCKKDYTLNGTSQLSCSEDGTFTPSPPKCIYVNCKEPDIPNGFWSGGAQPPYGYLATVSFECAEGYRMNGTAMQKCDLNSQWVPGLPKCTQDCDDPRKINPHVTVSRQPPYRQSTKVTLTCPPGEKPSGEFTVTCGKNGLWEPEIPKCKKEHGGSNVLIPALSASLVNLAVVLLQNY